MYEFPRLEVTSGQEHVRAQIVGNSGLAKKIQSLLKNQEVIADLAKNPETVNLSRRPDFIYWLLIQNYRKPPEILVNFLKSSQVKLIIISDEPITSATGGSISNFLDAGIDACQVFVKDIYGPSVEDNRLSLIWRDIKTKFAVNLPDDDDVEIYPIYLDDAAAAIIKISFSTQTYGRTFYISGADKTTVLSFSYRLREEVARQTQKLPPINYTHSLLRPSSIVHRPSSINDAAATRDFLSWRPETDLSKGLVKLVNSINLSGRFISRRTEDGIFETIEEEPNKAIFSNKPGGDDELSEDTKPSVSKKSRRGPFGRLIIKKKTTFHFRRGFVFPAVLAIVFFAAILSLPPLLDYLAAALAKNSPDRLARFESIFVLLGRRNQYDQIRQNAAVNLKQQQLSFLAGNLLESVFAPSSASPPEILDQLDSRSAGLLKILPPGETRRLLGLARGLIPSARLILTSDRKKTIAVVFQNSAELRPTGGSISSLAFITLQKGKILDIDYQSVDQLDSQLVGVETPPEPIKNHLGETNWLIRDANWSADADQSAQKLQSLIGRATGRSLDGVVFLTTAAFQRILTQTNGLTAPDGIVWHRLNLVDRLVYNDRLDPPFISLAKALEEFLKTNPARQKAITGALDAIDHQDLLLSFPDTPDIPDFVSCPPDFAACLSDQISVIDANLGANKADHFVVKDRDLSISLSDQKQIVTALTLRYQNSAASSQYPAGAFRNYVRVYLPADSVVASVIRLTPDGLVAVPTQNSMESGHKVIGWFMEIPVAGREVFRLEFTRPVKLALQNQVAAYGLTVKKQPGTAIPISISIGYPPNLVPLAVSDRVAVAQNKLLVNHSGDRNFSFNLEFAAVSD